MENKQLIQQILSNDPNAEFFIRIHWKPLTQAIVYKFNIQQDADELFDIAIAGFMKSIRKKGFDVLAGPQANLKGFFLRIFSNKCYDFKKKKKVYCYETLPESSEMPHNDSTSTDEIHILVHAALERLKAQKPEYYKAIKAMYFQGDIKDLTELAQHLGLSKSNSAAQKIKRSRDYFRKKVLLADEKFAPIVMWAGASRAMA